MKYPGNVPGPAPRRWVGALLACSFPFVTTAGEPTAFSADFKTREFPLGELDAGIASKTLRVSPDGKRIAYMAKLPDGGEAVFVDGGQSPRYEAIVNESLSFSPDSKRVAWGAVRGGKAIVVVDGREYPAYRGSVERMPVWSPDGRRFAYFAVAEDDKVRAVVDGEPDVPWNSVIVESFAFSPDGSRFAYVAKDGSAGRLVVNGQAGPAFRNIAGFAFSPDSRHFAYVAIREDSMAVIVDGKDAATARAFVKDSLGFETSDQLHVISVRGRELVRIQLNLSSLPPEPATASQRK